MSPPNDWAHALVERIPNSPAAAGFIGPHVVGQRITEGCALAARAVKRGTNLAMFLPGPTRLDVLTMAVYLCHVRDAVLNGTSAVNRWATLANWRDRRDLWVIGRATSLRKDCLEHFTVRCCWCARKHGQVVLEGVGAPEHSSLCVLDMEALVQGAWTAANAQHAKPFAILVDGTVHDGRELATRLGALRQLSHDAPLIVVANLGDKGMLLEMRRHQVPVWIMRAGDAARLPPVEPSARGTDRTSARLVAGINVNVTTLEAPQLRELLGPLLAAVQRLERLVADDATVTDAAELIGRARGLVRALLSLTVPWRLYLEALAAAKRGGRFATPTLEARLEALRTRATATGDIATALGKVVALAEEVFSVLRRPMCTTAKQGALLTAAQAAQAEHRSLGIVCENEAAHRAVQTFLGEHRIDVLNADSKVRVLTRSALKRATASGDDVPADELLLLDAVGFGSGIYFSGLAPTLRMLAYDFEREAVERQLQFIAHDTQSTSVAHGDKRAYVLGTASVPTDSAVESTPPLWRLDFTPMTAAEMFPDAWLAVEPFTFPDSDWLQQVLAGESIEVDDAHDPEPVAHETVGTRVVIELDDAEPPARFAPDTPLLVLDAAEQTGEGAIPANEARVGMTVLIPRAIGGDLLEQLLEQFDTDSEYITAAQFQRTWKDALALLMERANGSITQALRLLSEHDVGVTSTRAVGYWLSGIVTGPRDEKSVLALGLATQRSELIRHHHVIYAAQANIRQRRQRLARKLLEYIRAGQALGPDAIVDQALGLRRADLQDATRIGRIVSVVQAFPHAEARMNAGQRCSATRTQAIAVARPDIPAAKHAAH